MGNRSGRIIARKNRVYLPRRMYVTCTSAYFSEGNKNFAGHRFPWSQEIEHIPASCVIFYFILYYCELNPLDPFNRITVNFISILWIYDYFTIHPITRMKCERSLLSPIRFGKM